MTAYAELQVTSNFSFLRGGSHPEELVLRAAELGLAAIALTDRNTLAGVVRAHVAAKEVGIRFVVGARLDLMPEENQAARLPAVEAVDSLRSRPAATNPAASSPGIVRFDPRTRPAWPQANGIVSHHDMDSPVGPKDDEAAVPPRASPRPRAPASG